MSPGRAMVLALAAGMLFQIQAAMAQAPRGAAECADVQEDSARLACYDRYNPFRKQAAKAAVPAASPRTSSGTTAPSSAQVSKPAVAAPAAPAASAAAPASADANFGLDPEVVRSRQAASQGEQSGPRSVAARLTTVKQRPDGKWLLDLDNGQRWTQVDRSPGLILKSGDTVTIKEGKLGGYMLASQSGLTTRVKRLQ